MQGCFSCSGAGYSGPGARILCLGLGREGGPSGQSLAWWVPGHRFHLWQPLNALAPEYGEEMGAACGMGGGLSRAPLALGSLLCLCCTTHHWFHPQLSPRTTDSAVPPLHYSFVLFLSGVTGMWVGVCPRPEKCQIWGHHRLRTGMGKVSGVWHKRGKSGAT